MKNLSRRVGQRDGIAGLAATVRLKNDIISGVAEYLQPYMNWDTVKYFIDKNCSTLLDQEEYDMGLLGTVNYMKAALVNEDDLKLKVLFLCEQYQIHYEEKSADNVKNPHVEWVLKNYA